MRSCSDVLQCVSYIAVSEYRQNRAKYLFLHDEHFVVSIQQEHGPKNPILGIAAVRVFAERKHARSARRRIKDIILQAIIVRTIDDARVVMIIDPRRIELPSGIFCQLNELFPLALIDKNIVGRKASLARVIQFSGKNPLNREPQRKLRMDNRWAFTAEFQRNRR